MASHFYLVCYSLFYDYSFIVFTALKPSDSIANVCRKKYENNDCKYELS